MIVTKEHTALAMGSGDMEVLATPAMIALMENEAMRIAALNLDPSQTTVGVQIDATHTRATPIGAAISAVATLLDTQGRKLSFEIIASDDKGEIGRATHQRFIVDREKFLAKL